MLNNFDDLPIHQTPEPLAHPATSDRNFYDRTWFNGYSPDGEWYFGIGMAVYPYRGVLDCAFSVVSRGGKQHCFLASCRAPLERSTMQVGPFSIDVIEPMRRVRVKLDDNNTGISCDLTFTATSAPTEEKRQTLWSGTRRILDATRFVQFGKWLGSIKSPDGVLNINHNNSLGTKDRSWGVRGVGEPEVGGAPSQQAPSTFFLWAPLFWEDHATHALFIDGPSGETICSEGMQIPLYKNTEDIPATAQSGQCIEVMKGVQHRLRYMPKTRLIETAEIDMVNASGQARTINFEPLLKFQMKGLGYFHPMWAQGAWQGELAMHAESFDPMTLDAEALENLHVQQVVRVSDGNKTGVGVLEHVCIGDYAPYQLTGFADGAA